MGGDVVNTALVVTGAALVLCGLAIVVVQVRRGDKGFGPLRDESPETRRAVWRAIRNGETDDAAVDRLARQTIRVTPRLRWARYFFGAMLALSVVRLIIGPHTTGEVTAHVAQAGLWSTLVALDIINQRRLDRYRGLTGKSLPHHVPPPH